LDEILSTDAESYAADDNNGKIETGSTIPRHAYEATAPNFTNQNLKYAIYFGALPNLGGCAY